MHIIYLYFLQLTIMKQSFREFSILTSVVMFSVIMMTSLGMSHTAFAEEYDFVAGIHNEVTFHFRDGTEVVNFPEFYQGNLISKANPTFELVGVPAETPLLYEAVDDIRQIGSKSSGTYSLSKLFDVNIVLVYGDDIVRGFDYSKCRIVDYMIKTEHDLEESFYKGFALTNEFHFECLGYHPYDPKYDALFQVPKADTQSSIDWQSNQQSTWPANFRGS
jgi:hypothetical protein